MIRAFSSFTTALPEDIRWDDTGSSLSPKATETSRKPFLAFSSCACTVLFFTLNSFRTLVPSSYALLANA